MSYRGRKGWVCPVCKQPRGADGHDPCFGELPGVQYACCGHGGSSQSEGYIYFENGVRVGVVVTSISYEDGRPRVDVCGAAYGVIRNVLEILDRWQRADYMQLHAGEMTAQEIRSVKAVLKAVSSEIEDCHK